MAVFRVEKKKDYTCMSNHSLRNHNLSLKAKGLHALMLSLPEDWDYTLVGLKHICRESIGSINGAIQELEKEGYIIRTRARNEKGQLTAIEYSIYEVPPETTENKASEPNVEKPHVENPHMEKPHVENRSQVNTNKQNTNRPSTKGQRDAYLLTSRAREMEQAIDELRSFIEERIGRPLWHSEIRICTSWVKNNADMDMIHLAVEDNLFRRDNFDLKYVQSTLERWKSIGIDTPLKARNHILDSHVSNISVMAAEIAERNHNDELMERILMGSETKDLQGTRDYMIELYQQKRYDMLLSMARTNYHKDILDYLPDEVREFILKHSV
ncbi:MAG: DnaD domain protein [Clostridiales bacterium]|nr:DnaD domain protein [Clostridiales bacterium]